MRARQAREALGREVAAGRGSVPAVGRRGAAWAVALALALGAVFPAGCINLDPRPDPTRFYLLSGPPKPPEGSSATPVAPGYRVGVQRVVLPEYLRTPKMVVRDGDHEVRFSEFHRWGEELEAALGARIAAWVEGSPAVVVASAYPWPEIGSMSHSVAVVVRRFEGSTGGSAVLEARWEITELSNGQTLGSGRTVARTPWDASDNGALAAALSRALARLGSDLAGAFDPSDPSSR